MTTPVVALVGRPNVGKSTLFNRLTRTRDALVADFPGLTRDRKYGHAHLAGHDFIVIDTGGIDGTEEGVEEKMAEQSLLAIEEADIVLFLVDARAGLTSADIGIANYLRQRQNKTTVVVANKVDGIDADSHCAEFYQLGLGDVAQIAASQGRGVVSLMEQVLSPLAEQMTEESAVENPDVSSNDADTAEFDEWDEDFDFSNEEDTALLDEELAQEQTPDKKNIKIAIVGRPNVGKSTLTNRILGEDRVVVYDLPGTTRDSIYIPMERDNQDYTLIDTAGVRKRGKVHLAVEKFSVIKTLQAIQDANVVLLVIDARENISDQDLSLLGFILNAGRSLVIVVNKWDGLDTEVKNRVKSELDRRLDFIDFARVHFISALHGSGVGNLFDSIKEAYECATQKMTTSMLTRILQIATEEHQPPMISGRRVKLKYAHPGGYNPPIIVIHGNQVDKLPDSYKRYLSNHFRRSLKIIGSPIRLQFQEGNNPFAGRRNKLTPNQLRKRKRLMKFIKKAKR
ncbi:ribosome biogenesis GTPase Der [Aggregatibacter actinomycetemcomitans]|uniref:ribosome biogenesis GTPase Der n=1 Tax=Aggregatibacter actinomycetemcomitans TaxID=714 RepID=UPI0001B9F61D|nr:ribosome biogenesis GTPase Der [Aggregatibacter actinomycetemcomitans]AEW77190.1 GTP-binding protein EngA [Aggregatibacter actinomycetemcomitans ANH9381]ACX82287.1 GTP-binding protein Der [Aggregatibacter actinomycetemcomitans D11S-1]KOE53690.1 GTP-binding protein Der [Aggregatibacter actinomycetemcomitans serotype b str. I23C]KOE56926.1 GTP-binding protein Der [Aggregatibacter actinomycetemcomitans serotype b str. S23A]KOE57649.1 GTP-binding protein Der [Aggregatibacter actinomycetemcomita